MASRNRRSQFFARFGFANRLQDLFDRRLDNQELLPGDGLAFDLHGELAAAPVHHFDFDSRFFPQRVRHPGGMLSCPDSDRALANGDLRHG